MRVLRKAGLIASGVFMILGALIILLMGEDGYLAISVVMTIILFVTGIGMLINFFMLNRFMVGGRRNLYMGLIFVDIALFMMTLNSIPKFYLVIYLVVVYVFTGVIDVLRAREAKAYNSPEWKLTIAAGIANILIGLVSLIFIRNIKITVIIYAGGLIYSAVLRIASAFKKNEIIYIQ